MAVAAAIVVQSATACSLGRGPKPQIHRYTLGPASSAALSSDRPVIESRPVLGIGTYRDTGIAYQSSPYRLDSYTFSRWAASPVEMVSARLNEVVEQPPTGPRRSMPAMVLDARLSAFQEVDEGGKVSGLVEIEFCLRPKRPPSVAIWCKVIRHETVASADTREAAVAAITISLNAVIDELTAELNREFQSLPAAEAQARDEDEESPPRRRVVIPSLH
ncbi:MAG TPA: hypothetical protein VEU51_06530 [Candidatus Acidoferrales bacterium]|nr:hypothetical protein [Candidatus Acidoferrales bacterium]